MGEYAKTPNLLIFPNPTSGEVNIHWRLETGNGIIQVVDYTGKIVKFEHIEDWSVSLFMDLSGFHSCLYLIQCISSDKVESASIVIE